MISSCRVATSLALITRASPYLRLVKRLVFTPCLNRVSPHNPLVPSTLARARRAYPSQARLGYAGAERSAPHLALIQHHLIYIQIMVETALFKQFFMASLLNDAAVL